MTLTAEPWAVTPEMLRAASRAGLDEEQLEVAVAVIAMFNYFTRVADASGIEFDYETPLPAFEPDRGQVAAPRPDLPSPDPPSLDPPGTARPPAGLRRRPRDLRIQEAWDSWRAYLLDADQPISTRDRRLVAAVAAEEATDWAGAEALSEGEAPADADDRLVRFARKLSRQPWRMNAGDLDSLRASGYPEKAILHVISVVAHQSADSRLVIGLAAAGG